MATDEGTTEGVCTTEEESEHYRIAKTEYEGWMKGYGIEMINE